MKVLIVSFLIFVFFTSCRSFGIGYLIVNSKPHASVIIDGESMGRSTPIGYDSPIVLSEGEHRLELELEGRIVLTDKILIRAGRFSRHIYLLKPKTSEKESVRKLGLGIIGIRLEEGKACIRVEEVLENYPASCSGIKKGDCIIAVDSEEMSDKTILEVVEKIRGVPGTFVTLTIKRENEIKNFKVRRVIFRPSPSQSGR